MKLQIASLISFLLLLNYRLIVSAANEDYFKRSILVDIQEKKASFSSDIELVNPEEKSVNHYEEKYSFDLTIGEFIGQEKFAGQSKERFTAKLIYINNAKEAYEIDKYRKSCEHQEFGTATKLFWNNWAPSEVYDEKANYPIIGPNVLLLSVLTENLGRVPECEKLEDDSAKKNYRRCILEFPFSPKQELNKTARLEYYFEDRGSHTMYPEKIIVKSKEPKAENWVIKKQMNYFKFEPSFLSSNQKPIVSSNLPIGYGCERPDSKKSHYPKVETKFGDNFEMKYEVVFRYLDTKNNSNPHRGPLFLLDNLPVDTKSDENQPKDENPRKKNYLTRIYFNTMYQDSDNLINVVDSLNELTNASTRTIYETNTHVAYDLLLDEDKCMAFHLKPVHNINYFYVQDLFINHKKFFIANDENEFVYLGRYNVRDVPSDVYEKKISDFSEKVKTDNQSKNQMYLDVIRKNINGIESNYATVTHYYPVLKDFWGKDAKQFNVPMKIEIRLYTNEDRIDELAMLTINVASYKFDIDKYDIYDVTKCAKKAYDYNWFLVKFDDNSEAVKKYKRFEAQIKNTFKQLLDISPLRVGEVLVDSDENSIYVTAKLMELAQVEGYFHSKENLTIKNAQVDEFADSEELCARRCFSNKNCAAYAYCGALDCKLWLDNKFDEEFDPKKPEGKDYDWKKIETEENKECTYSTRFVKFNPRTHISNREFLESLNAQIEQEEFEDLMVVNEFGKEQSFSASELKVNVQPGRHTTSSSKLGDEKFNDERNHIKYNDLFNITNANEAFNKDKFDGESKKELISLSHGLSLWECQLICINDNQCQSMSYCRGSNECIITSLNATHGIGSYTLKNQKCSTSVKINLAKYHKHNKRGLTKDAEKIFYGQTSLELSANDCAAKCSNYDQCQSFDYCENVEGAKEEKIVCLLHNVHPLKDKTEDKKPHWTTKSHCDHYTYKHSLEFNEYSTFKLKEADIGSHQEISLDHCASLCSETEYCNSFDFCVDKKNPNGHLDSIHCRLSSEVYKANKVETKQFDCSTYSRINPKVLTRKVDKYTDNPVSGLSVSFLSILGLIVGIGLGAGAAYYVITNYNVSF